MVARPAPNFPDALARNPQPLKFLPVDDHLVLDDGTMRVDVYHAVGHLHMAEAVFAYIPGPRIFLEGDFTTPRLGLELVGRGVSRQRRALRLGSRDQHPRARHRHDVRRDDRGDRGAGGERTRVLHAAGASGRVSRGVSGSVLARAAALARRATGGAALLRSRAGGFRVACRPCARTRRRRRPAARSARH